MIARVWQGATRAPEAARYAAYLQETGVRSLAATPGNQGVLVFHRIEGDLARFTVISLWETLEAIVGFAGQRVERAVYYPQDDAFLVERGPIVEHWTVDATAGLAVSPSE